jgi:hypothetical protein
MKIFTNFSIFCVTLITLTISVLAFAAGGSGTQAISEVKINSNGNVEIWGQDGDWSDPDGCNGGSAQTIILRPDHNFYPEIYALLVSSYLQGKSISARLRDCDGSSPIIISLNSN